MPKPTLSNKPEGHPQPPQKTNDKDIRNRLTFILAGASLAGIVLVSGVHIWSSSNREEAGERVFNTTMPLFGTWMGTLIAYYFAKENLDAATESTRQLTDSLLSTSSDNLDKIPVSAAIRGGTLLGAIILASPKSGDGEDDPGENRGDGEKLVQDVISELMDKNSIRRLPIFEMESNKDADLTGDKLKFLVYYEDLSKYCKDNPRNTLREFVSDGQEKSRKFVFVGKNVSLGDANRERLKEQGCQDVFVTNNGLKSEKVIGYLTESHIDQFRTLASGAA